MHKKPIYSFENFNSTGVNEVPLLSLMAIENTVGHAGFDDKPALIIVLAKNGVTSTSTVGAFIANGNNWMYIYNQDLVDEFNNYVKKAGDTMTGKLTINNELEVQNSITGHDDLEITRNSYLGGDVSVGKYFNVTDYDDGMTHGIRSYVRDGVWHLNKNSGESHNIFIDIEGNQVLTTKTGVMFDDWASVGDPSATDPALNGGGIIRCSRVGNTLYMANNKNTVLPTS